MTQNVAFYALQGGLDLATPAISLSPGRAIAALNYEPDPAGYRRITGYERFDGRTSPTDAYDAEADIATAEAARDAARTAITAIPGSGAVRGVWYYNDNVYGFRDNAGATACVMHKATAAGWVEVALSLSLNFTSGGTTAIAIGDTITGATSGATAVVAKVVVTSGSWAAGTAAGYLTLSSQTGTFQAENLNIGATLDVATIAGDSARPTLPAGGRYHFINHNFYGLSNLHRMYGCNGVGKAFEFDGTIFTPITVPGVPTDAPTRIAAHRKHLFLAFPGGSLQHSSTGDPLTWSAVTGASEIAVGDEIMDLLPATTTSLAILSKSSVSVLYGNDTSDWQLDTISDEAGALPYTAEKLGTAIYCDNRGLRSITATQAYGNFELGTMTFSVAALMRSKIAAGVLPTGCVRVRSKDLYRLFFSDNTGISVYIGRKQPEILPFALGHKVECICSVEDEDRKERVYFGSSDGFVYQMDKGRSFDGASLSYYLRLPFNHLGAPQLVKRWHKATIECDIIGTATLRLSGEVDYADPAEASMASTTITPSGGGGFWDASIWNEFNWGSAVEGQAEAYLDGIGRNMSLLIGGEASDEDPHLLQGITLHYSVRGLRR